MKEAEESGVVVMGGVGLSKGQTLDRGGKGEGRGPGETETAGGRVAGAEAGGETHGVKPGISGAHFGWNGESGSLSSGMEAWRGQLRPGHEASLSRKGLGFSSDLGKPRSDWVAARIRF